MDKQIASKLELLIGRTLSMESKIENLERTLEQKVNPEEKEWLSDDCLESLYGFTKAIRNKLYYQKKLKRYKPSGKAGPSLYRKSEVDNLIKDGISFPKYSIK